MPKAMSFKLAFVVKKSPRSTNSTLEYKIIPLWHILPMFQNQMDNSNFDVSVKDNFALFTCKTHNVLGHGDHFLTKQIDIFVSFLKFS